jgi:chromate reductase, NAD(P)H dehydrogenase (quinone)
MRLLFFAGSAREGSYNKKLAMLAQRIAEANGLDAVFVDLRDYEMPIYDGDYEAENGPPQGAREFKELLDLYQGVFIATPEYNSGVSPLLKNTLDWVTRVRQKGESGLEVFKNRVFAIGSAAPGNFGGMRSLLQLRQIISVGLGGLVIPEQVAIPRAGEAFESDGSLVHEQQQELLKTAVEKLAIAVKAFASR